MEEKSGETLLYDLIEKSRDLLTTLNSAVGNRCPICLYELTEMDQIVRNECFHHLHCRCFAEYVSTQTQITRQTERSLESNQKVVKNISDIEIQCPVCRIELKSNDFNSYLDPNKYSAPYLSNNPLEDELNIIESAKNSQKLFQHLYEKQLKNGGIIDSEINRNKFFLRISQINDQTIIS